ncbi:MAG: S8 family serine peptidase [Xanthomonadales bacterium]|nr:S8 family serine peptidase [Xanthomonadales bacterium]
MNPNITILPRAAGRGLGLLVGLVVMAAGLSGTAGAQLVGNNDAHVQACTISFDSASMDVCSGRVTTLNPDIAPLADLRRHAGSPLRVVKFGREVGQADRDDLQRLGATVIAYVPHFAFLVRMPATNDAAIRALPGVAWSGPFLPAWKLESNLAADLARAGDAGRLSETVFAQAGLEYLSIELHEGADRSATRNALLSAPGIALHSIQEVGASERLVVSFQAASLRDAVFEIAGNPEVGAVGYHWPAENFNSQAGWLHQSGTNSGPSQLPVFERGLFGCGQLIGMLDSGLHAANCAFSDINPQTGQPRAVNTSSCTGGTSCTAIAVDNVHRKIGAHYKWNGGTGGPADGHGHGTHVAGSILGNNPTGAVDCANFTTPGGLTNLDGTAPGARIISQEAGAGLEYLNTRGGNIYHAVQIAYQNGARIHNNSWGSSCRNQSNQCISGCQVNYIASTRDADRVAWDFPEMAVFVAAGNSGGLGGSSGCGPGADVGAPGNAKNVFSIGSNNRGTAGNDMSSFSSRGPTSDRRSKPDMTAQGGSIVSSSRTTCGTTTMSGTSMATPTASGLAALVRDYLARGYYPTGNAVAANAIATPSAALVKSIMVNGAHSITGTGTQGGAPSQSQGWGRINLNNSLHFAGNARQLWLHDAGTGLQTNGLDSHTLNVQAGQPLVVTLVWHDAPALLNANPHGVNRLRLEVVAPDGSVWTQKLPATGGLNSPNPFADTTTSNYDTVNTVHNIRLASPQSGTYTVRVRGVQVAQGPQRYALAATGAFGSGAPPTWTVSGSVTTSGGAGIAGVTVSAGSASATTNSAGAYTISGLANGGYTLTPSLAGYTFSPVTRSVTVNGANVTGQNFTGTATPTTFSVSGSVTTSGGAGIAGVTVSAGSASATTNSAGAYTISGLANGGYTLTPSLSGYTFSPVSRSVTVNGANVTGQNFTGTASGSGPVALANGVPVNSSVNSTTANSDYKEFTIAVPAGASNLVVATTNATGDVDLYLRFGQSPGTGTGQWDCRPYQSSGNETCTVASPQAGTYFARVYGYATGLRTFTITASWTAGGGGPVQRLANGNFDTITTSTNSAPDGSWSRVAFSGTSFNTLLAGQSNAHTGGSYAYLGVNNSASQTVDSAAASIPAAATTATLSLHVSIVTQETTTTQVYDRLFIELVDASNNQVLQTLATLSNLDRTSSASTYVQRSYNVVAHKGRNVKVRLRATTDGSLTTQFRVDTVSLLADGG